MTLCAFGALRTSAAAELLLETRKGCTGRATTEATLKPTCVPGINARTRAVVLSAMPAANGCIDVDYTKLMHCNLLAAVMQFHRSSRPQRMGNCAATESCFNRHAVLQATCWQQACVLQKLTTLSRVGKQHVYCDSCVGTQVLFRPSSPHPSNPAFCRAAATWHLPCGKHKSQQRHRQCWHHTPCSLRCAPVCKQEEQCGCAGALCRHSTETCMILYRSACKPSARNGMLVMRFAVCSSRL